MMAGATPAPAVAPVSPASMPASQHITVLLHEAVDALNIKPNGTYIDGKLSKRRRNQ